MKPPLFAIEINESVTRIASARFENGVVFLESIGTTDTEPGFFTTIDTSLIQQKQAHIIHTLCTDLKISSKHVNVVIPDAVSYAQVLETPILSESDLVSSIRYQADEFIPMKVEDTYLDLEILKQDTDAGKLDILIVAAPRKMVDGIYRSIELAGLTPARLETEVSAISRLVSEVMQVKQVHEGYCILNMGYSASSLYVIDTNTSALVFYKTCKIGFDLVLREIMTNLNITKEAAIALLAEPGTKRSEVVTSISTSLKELGHEVDRLVEAYTRRFSLPVQHIFSINFSSYISDFNRLMTSFTSYQVESLPLNTVYVPNPVVKAFSSEITGFASVVSSITV